MRLVRADVGAVRAVRGARTRDEQVDAVREVAQHRRRQLPDVRSLHLVRLLRRARARGGSGES